MKHKAMYTPALTALSPLTWGRELKLYLLGGLLIFGKSPLTWGRELKLVAAWTLFFLEVSPLTWGRELKLKMQKRYRLHPGRPLRGGVN